MPDEFEEDNFGRPVGKLIDIPQIQSFLMCDHVMDDRNSGKKSLIGVFDNFISPTFPFKHAGCALYISISGGQGIVPFKIKMISLETLEGEIILKDAWRIVRPADPIPPLIIFIRPEFRKPGAYLFELSIDKPGHKDNGHAIYGYKFMVRQATGQAPLFNVKA